MTGLLAIIAVFFLLLFAEYLRKTKRIHGEIARKFVHITVGTFVALWPFFMDIVWIELISLAFFVVILASRYLKLFPSIHGIERKSWGDVFFPLGIGLTAVVAQSPWIFTAALLCLSLGDGFAAVVGEKHGKGTRYKVFGYTKSVVGSLTFLVISMSIMVGLVIAAPASFGSVAFAAIVLLPILATLLENIASHGTDNIVVPVTLAILLNTLQLFS